MKVTNTTAGPIYLKDLRLVRQGQTEARRTEDQYLRPGASVYLPDTSEVLRSAQKGDLRLLARDGKVSLNDVTTLAAFPGPGNVLVIQHGLGYVPIVTILKRVLAGPIVTWVEAVGTLDVVHNADFTETTLTNVVALPIEFLVRIG